MKVVSERPTLPLFDEDSVRYALERLRRAEPLGESQLRSLVWIQQQIDTSAPVASHAGLEVALWAALTGIIEQNLAHLRAVEGLANLTRTNREAALEDLRRDFARSNTELEAWSVLYYRYVRLDLDLHVQTLAHILNVWPRHIQRRLAHGYRRLTEQLSHFEAQARAGNWRAWLRMKLPPAHYSTLFGRQKQLDQLCQLLTAPQAPYTIGVVGVGGIGKTALIHAALQRLIQADQVPDLAWVTLGARTSLDDLLEALDHRLRTFSHPVAQSSTELEASLRMRLQARPALIVVDQADWLMEVELVLSRLSTLSEPTHLVVGMRQLPPAELPMHLIQVEPLPREDMQALLRETARLRHKPPVSIVDRQFEAIYQAIGGNPLAGRLVIGQLASLPLERVLANLAGLPATPSEGLFDVLFKPAWDALSEEAQHVALAISLFPEGVLWHDLHVAVELPADTLDRALHELVTASLVDVDGSAPRYSMQPLNRHFASAIATQAPWNERIRTLLSRAVKARVRPVKAEESSVPPPDEAAHVLGLLHYQLEAHERVDRLAEIAIRIAPSVRRCGQWRLWQSVLRAITATTHTKAVGKRPALRARLLIELGIANRWLGEQEAAVAAFKEAVALSGEQGDFQTQAEALVELGQLYQFHGLTEPAYEAYQRAAAAAARWRLPEVRLRALHGLASLALHSGHANAALDLLEQASEMQKEGSTDGQTLSLMGIARLELGDIGQAVDLHLRALNQFGEEGDLPRQARTLLNLGIAYHAAGHNEEALDSLNRALAVMRQLGDAPGQARLLTNLGTVFADSNRPQEALETWQVALKLQNDLGDWVGMAHTWYNLADLRWRAGQVDEARRNFEQAGTLANLYHISSLLALIAAHPLNASQD